MTDKYNPDNPPPGGAAVWGGHVDPEALKQIYRQQPVSCRCEIHKVVHVLDLMASLMRRMEAQMADFSALKNMVADMAAAVDAAVVKIDELKAAIPADQQPEVDAIVADIAAKVDQLKAAVA